jgi:hypothetical protein
MPGGAIIIIGHRMHDLQGRLIERGCRQPQAALTMC